MNLIASRKLCRAQGGQPSALWRPVRVGWGVGARLRKWQSPSRVQFFTTPWAVGPWDSPGQNTGLGSLSLLQGIFRTEELNQSLMHCRWIVYQLSWGWGARRYMYTYSWFTLLYNKNQQNCKATISQLKNSNNSLNEKKIVWFPVFLVTALLRCCNTWGKMQVQPSLAAIKSYA